MTLVLDPGPCVGLENEVQRLLVALVRTVEVAHEACDVSEQDEGLKLPRPGNRSLWISASKWGRQRHVKALLQVRGSLTEGKGGLRAPRRLERAVRRALGKARLRVLVREPIGLARGDLWEPRLNDLGNASVQLLAPAPEERLVGRLVHKGV